MTQDKPDQSAPRLNLELQELIAGMERGAFHIHFPRRFTNLLRLARLLPYRGYFWLIAKVTGL